MTKKCGYVDSFILPVPSKNLVAYKKWARIAGKVWMEHGALSYAECLGDDVPSGSTTSFPKSVKLKRGEKVVFAWATYKSRGHRNQVMKKVMADPRLEVFSDPKRMPFDGMRMYWGGFKPILEL